MKRCENNQQSVSPGDCHLQVRSGCVHFFCFNSVCFGPFPCLVWTHAPLGTLFIGTVDFAFTTDWFVLLAHVALPRWFLTFAIYCSGEPLWDFDWQVGKKPPANSRCRNLCTFGMSLLFSFSATLCKAFNRAGLLANELLEHCDRLPRLWTPATCFWQVSFRQGHLSGAPLPRPLRWHTHCVCSAVG